MSTTVTTSSRTPDEAITAAKAERDGGAEVVDESVILRGAKLWVVFGAMLLSIFLIALDQTILATALPRIASDFDSFSQQGWVSSAFVLAQTGCLLPWSQIIRIFPTKWTLLISITIFEIGSVVCGTSKQVNTLIGGRAITGLGAAGIYISMQQTLTQVTLIQDRARLFGLFGAVVGLSSIIGPLIGGAFTDHVSWRWCFFINLPLGGVTLLVVTFFVKAAPPLGARPTDDRSPRSLMHQALRLDWIGAILVIGSVTSLVMALQWGGNTKPWDSAGVITCLVVAAVLAIALVVWQIYMKDGAMVPTVIFNSISIYAICFYSFAARISMLMLIYYLPIYYQAGKGEGATKSGVSILAFMMAFVISAIIAGQIVGRFGRYWPFLLLGPIPLGIGAGILYTITETSSSSLLIGLQILMGVGTGVTAQNSQFAMQAEFNNKKHLLAQAMGINTFSQYLGATIGLSLAESVLSSQLTKNILKYAPTAPLAIIEESPTTFRSDVPAALISPVVSAYVKSLTTVFIIAVPVGGVQALLALLIHNINIAKKPAPKGEAKSAPVAVDAADIQEKRASASDLMTSDPSGPIVV